MKALAVPADITQPVVEIEDKEFTKYIPHADEYEFITFLQQGFCVVIDDRGLFKPDLQPNRRTDAALAYYSCITTIVGDAVFMGVTPDDSEVDIPGEVISLLDGLDLFDRKETK